MTVHKLSLALWSSSPFTTEVLRATLALYHVSGINYLAFLSKFVLTPKFVSPRQSRR